MVNITAERRKKELVETIVSYAKRLLRAPVIQNTWGLSRELAEFSVCQYTKENTKSNGWNKKLSLEPLVKNNSSPDDPDNNLWGC